MKVGKMIEELQKCDLDAVIKLHCADGDELKMIRSFLGCIALQTKKEDDADSLRAEYTEERFTYTVYWKHYMLMQIISMWLRILFGMGNQYCLLKRMRLCRELLF